MTEPQRLLDGAGDDVQRALLSSARNDGPSAQAMRRCLVALSLGGAAAATAATASAATLAKASVPPAASAASAATGATTAGISVLVKWVGIAGIGALATWGAVSQVGGDAPMVLTSTVVPAPIEVPAATPPEPAGQLPVAEEEAPIEEAAEVAAPVQAKPTRNIPTPGSPAQKPPDLAAEVAALDKARKQMEEDPDAALDALSQYGDDFKGGALVQEAEVLRIESLARAGKKKEARAAAASFLARHSTSPAAGRVRALLARLKD